jgi:acylphosphatase
MTCRRYIVRGRVQGVFFRAATRNRARELALTGHARNLADGSVEVLACGDEAALSELEAWLWQGPPAARVASVESEAAPDSAPTGFETR